MVLACAGFVSLSFGFTLPLLTLVMENDGIDPARIGLSTACESAAVLFIGPPLPGLLGRWGMRRVMLASSVLGMVTIVALAFTDPRTLWFPIRFLLGTALFTLVIETQVWLTRGASRERRGRVVAAYGMAITGGFAGGPLIVSVTGSSGTAPFFVGVVLLACAAVSLLFAHGPEPTLERRGRTRLETFLLGGPVLLAAALGYGIIEGSVLSLLPVYGLHGGMSETKSVLLLSALVAGALVLQLPIGWLGDRTDRYRVLLLCGIAGVAGTALLTFVLHLPWALWITLMVLGGSGAGLYVVSLAILGDRFTGLELAAAVAGLDMILGLGSTVGPVLAGGAMRLWDPHGLTLVIVGAFGLSLLARFLRAPTQAR
jgi:MFS family permease